MVRLTKSDEFVRKHRKEVKKWNLESSIFVDFEFWQFFSCDFFFDRRSFGMRISKILPIFQYFMLLKWSLMSYLHPELEVQRLIQNHSKTLPLKKLKRESTCGRLFPVTELNKVLSQGSETSETSRWISCCKSWKKRLRSRSRWAGIIRS